MSQTEEAKRNILINQFTVALAQESRWQINMGIQRLLTNAWAEGFDALDLLYEALRKIKEPDTVNLQKLQVKSKPKGTSISARLSCNICSKVFEKGMNAWIGSKRTCKKECTVVNLIPA